MHHARTNHEQKSLHHDTTSRLKLGGLRSPAKAKAKATLCLPSGGGGKGAPMVARRRLITSKPSPHPALHVPM